MKIDKSETRQYDINGIDLDVKDQDGNRTYIIKYAGLKLVHYYPTEDDPEMVDVTLSCRGVPCRADGEPDNRCSVWSAVHLGDSESYWWWTTFFAGIVQDSEILDIANKNQARAIKMKQEEKERLLKEVLGGNS